MYARAMCVFLLLLTMCQVVQAQLLDTMDSTEGWEIFVPEGVRLEITQAAGTKEGAIRLDYAFDKGGGFAIIRKSFDIDIRANYMFDFWIKGDGPANDLEFKLLDETGANVWWHNRRRFSPPSGWTKQVSTRRNIEFAWGPASDRTLHRVAAIEFAIASAEGGAGTVYLDNLSFSEIPEPVSLGDPVIIKRHGTEDVSTAVPSRFPQPLSVTEGLTINLEGPRELGGMVLGWNSAQHSFAYTIEGQTADGQWEHAVGPVKSESDTDVVTFLGEGYARLRLQIHDEVDDLALTHLEFIPIGAFESQNELLIYLAEHGIRDFLPVPYIGRRVFWTVSGLPEGNTEALLDEFGSFEPVKAGPRIQPALLVDGVLHGGWNADSYSQSLAQGWMPVPSASWNKAGLQLTAELVPLADDAGFRVQYTVTNTGSAAQTGDLVLAVRPFQVLPHWQKLNVVGGTSPITSISMSPDSATVNNNMYFTTSRPASRIYSTPFMSGEIMQRLTTSNTETAMRSQADDESGLASGAWRYSFDLDPGETMNVVVNQTAARVDGTFNESKSRAIAAWDQILGEFWIKLPSEYKHLEDSVRASIAYSLVNRDGPAIQPGSRTYERTWIRDGSLTSHALLSAGLHDKATEFLNWYATFQFDNGKAPCCVDGRGSDPVDEHDSTGQYIHAVWSCYQHTRDESFLRHHYPSIKNAMGYIKSLREQRMGKPYSDPSSPMHVFYGLVPESISHEGYSARPMHSYWDDFFILLGISDASNIAHQLGEVEDAKAWREFEADFRKTLHSSISIAMASHSIDYIPGCAELGDFDATSTAIAAFPVNELGALPKQDVVRTFERYWQLFTARRDNTTDWHDYTPYEVRVIGTMTDIGEPSRAHEMIDYFLAQQTPTGWRQWPEVVHKDVRGPGFIGDLPHSWVACDFANSITSLLVHWDRDATTLSLARGVPMEWINGDGGVEVRQVSTPFGKVSYSIKRVGDVVVLDITQCENIPENGILIDIYSPQPILMNQLRIESVPIRLELELQNVGSGI